MPRFFVERIEDPVVLPPREARHAVRALRLGPGDSVLVFDGRETWRGEIESAAGRVTIRLRERMAPVSLPAVTVAAAVPKGSRLDWMVEKLAEMGINVARRTVAKYRQRHNILSSHWRERRRLVG
ncbi:MAG: RsmE family RNA methyltransferase [Planctomycetota bacterium]